MVNERNDGASQQPDPDKAEGESITVSLAEVYNVLGDAVEHLIAGGEVRGNRDEGRYILPDEDIYLTTVNTTGPFGLHVPENIAQTGEDATIMFTRYRSDRRNKPGMLVESALVVINDSTIDVRSIISYDKTAQNPNETSLHPRPNTPEAVQGIRDLAQRLTGQQ